MDTIVDEIDLNCSVNNDIIRLRFLEEIKFYEKKRNRTGIYYNIFRFSVTTGSIILPALLSIGQMDPAKLPNNFDQISYWTTWIISLIVTMSNGFLQLFSLDKNYFNYAVVVEQLKTEGWQFFSLSGKYDQYNTHEEAYKLFLKYIEGIKRKQVEQEFSSSKGDKKKKEEFNFKKELDKFQNNAVSNSQNQVQSINNTIEENTNTGLNQMVGGGLNQMVGGGLSQMVGSGLTQTINSGFNQVAVDSLSQVNTTVENSTDIAPVGTEINERGVEIIMDRKPVPPPINQK